MSATSPAWPAAGDALAAAPPRAWWREVARRFARDRWALAAAALLVLVHLAAIAAPWLAANVLHQSPYRSRIMDRVSVHGRLQDVVSDDGVPLGPCAALPLGADALGRDVLARILFGARVSLAVATFGTLLAVLLGLVAGLLAGYYRGWLDSVISRFVDAMMAIPVLLLAIALAAVFQQGGMWTIVFVLGLVNWTYLARLIRAEVLSLREREFVEAARALGAGDASIIARHLLPSLTGPIVVFATLSMAGNILLESALSFLGVGIQPPTPSWGNMIQEGMPLYNVAWWVSLFPGLAILLAVVCYNLVGEALKAALDPGSSPGGER